MLNKEPPLWALQRFERSYLLSENYSDALQILFRPGGVKKEEERGQTGHLTGSWNKGARKITETASKWPWQIRNL